MKRITIVLAVVAALFAAALPAMAHHFGGTGDCKGWTLQLSGTHDAVQIRIGNQVQASVQTEYFITDNVASRTSRSFSVTWDKAPIGAGGGDVTYSATLERSTADCVDYEVSTSCGVAEVSSFRNDTNISYAVAFEEGAATYDLGNAQFGSITFPENYNGGSVDVSHYLVGGEQDFIIGDQTDLPNFWEQTAATVTVETDCIPGVTPVAPEVVPSEACEVEGSFTIPETEGVEYLLDGEVIAAGTYEGPASGTITAQAVQGYELTDPEFEFVLDLEAAVPCPTTTTTIPEEPTTTTIPDEETSTTEALIEAGWEAFAGCNADNGDSLLTADFDPVQIERVFVYSETFDGVLEPLVDQHSSVFEEPGTFRAPISGSHDFLLVAEAADGFVAVPAEIEVTVEECPDPVEVTTPTSAPVATIDTLPFTGPFEDLGLDTVQLAWGAGGTMGVGALVLIATSIVGFIKRRRADRINLADLTTYN